jgi:hypothetical protein
MVLTACAASDSEVKTTSSPSTKTDQQDVEASFATPSMEQPEFVGKSDSLSLASAQTIPDLNGNGFDHGDWSRVYLAFRQALPVLRSPFSAPFGMFLGTDGRLETAGVKDGKLEIVDFLPVFQRYISQAWYYDRHSFGSAKFGNQLINCINAGPSCTKTKDNITLFDVNLDGGLNAMDSLAIANFMNCIDKIKAVSGRSDNSFYTYTLTGDVLLSACGK